MFNIVSFKLEWEKNARKVQLEQFLGIILYYFQVNTTVDDKLQTFTQSIARNCEPLPPAKRDRYTAMCSLLIYKKMYGNDRSIDC